MPSTSPEPKRRCAWAESDPLLRTYHDVEWGVPERDGRRLWEMLALEGFQAGLSWTIILRKRDAFRAAFRGFDPKVVATFRAADVARLLRDPGIVRSRAKIAATIDGARIYVAMEHAGEPFGTYVWNLAGGRPVQGSGRPTTQSELSVAVSSALRTRGFRFVGPVIAYAWMQAVGLVNDHARTCFRRGEVATMGDEGPPSQSMRALRSR
ncbi:MAG TPA: DNA-3-methyladenine glycosylase I [Thermoplasmata archaeon]|jgi:DNA-3-methyladenine glycosylase I|nr:DNA-3-methyladenine glycosylase I [Thermoplasmata archaeon]